ncbi:OadG family protein [Halomarina litorea]|uniref:OadG family protein n=1 Tax=Halomarina litorea TaxID=2961595 RepID=UPI0020C481BA|nr:OadG family protein [Halomarina sp. BCD28]
MSDRDTDDTLAPDEHDHHDSDTPEPRPDHRTTAPQSPYTNRDVGVGFVVALVGMLVVFVVPILLTL